MVRELADRLERVAEELADYRSEAGSPYGDVLEDLATARAYREAVR